MCSDVYNIIPLPYPATQSLLPAPLKPQLYTSPKNQHTHTHTIINEISITRHKYKNGAENYFYKIIIYYSFKLMNISLLPIKIFLNINSLRTQMFNFIPRDRTIMQLCLMILIICSLMQLMQEARHLEGSWATAQVHHKEKEGGVYCIALPQFGF